MSTVALVYPNQLFDEHPAFEGADRAVLHEDDLYFRDERYPARNHKLRLVLHRATMRRYADRLRDAGLEVEYVAWADRVSTADLLKRFAEEDVETVRLCEPVDFVLEKRLHAGAAAADVDLEVVDTPLFLNTRQENADFFAGRKRYFMADFYKHQRRRLGIMVDGEGKPAGGKWSYDHDNRKKLTKAALEAVPPLPSVEQDAYATEAQAYVEEHFPDHVGASGPLPYPTDHDGAGRWLEVFVQERLEQFGPFEDAIEPGRSHLYHGVLTPMLNVGLLTPHQVLDAVLEADGIPLNSLEGFVRQIIGWREYMRAVYDLEGVTMRNGNVWGFEREIPDAWYTGETGLAPVDDVIPRVLETGYANHIERLMVLGGALFLSRFHPRHVYRWFSEMFIDAYDWVMVSNTYGMSQHAAGPIITTKPYMSGSNYLRKMSHYPRGDWEAEWDGLYWTFLRDYRDELETYRRMSLVTGHLDRMSPEKLEAHEAAATRYLERIGLEDE
ncbi:cryptochrome/photolyase family protein [Rubrivirga sp.]|uniref:cryptochrome/photolyase family protein n=1 Tax=Rubrivirga sp. TaxID=1885344 RepID=UPI003C7139C2